jgi:uncharacterized membrane protein
VALAYTLLSAGSIPRATTGMVTLLLFALVTFLYGVHLDRRFMGVGVFLGLSYVVMSYMAAYIWILLLIAVLMVAVAIFMMKRTYSKQTATGPVVTPPVLLPERIGEDFVQEAQPESRQREGER